MIDLYVRAKNTLTGLESALRIAISNANNFNVPGFKFTTASFTTVYSEAISNGTKSRNPMHTGTSMTLGATTTDFSQGNITIGTALDLALVGEGFMLVSSSASEFDAGSSKLYTRSGRFQVDSNNQYLVDSFGRKVFGFKLDEQGNKIGNEMVPIETGGNVDIGFLEGGILTGNYLAAKEDNTQKKPLYQIALTSFQNKQGLVIGAGGAYKPTVASGEQFEPGVPGAAISTADSTVYAEALPESLESSNIDVARVALDMNILNRGFNAVQGVIDDVTKILQGLLPKIGG